MARAQNDTADGYVDPAIPNPNGSNDAPIIIYGYVYFTLPALLPSLSCNPILTSTSLLLLQLYTDTCPCNPSPRPLCPRPHPPYCPPLPASPVGILRPLPSHCPLRNRWLCLPLTLLPAPRRRPLQRDKLRNPVLLHRRRARIFLRRHIHNAHLAHRRTGPEPEPAGA